MGFREANCQQLLTVWRKNGRCGVKSGGQWLDERLGDPGSNLPCRPGKAKPPPGNVSEQGLVFRAGFVFLQGLF